MRVTKTLLIVFASIILISSASAASGFGGSITVGEVSEDATYSGGNIIVEGPVNGDLTVFGGNLYIEGDVNGNVSVFAGNARIDGDISGNVDANTGNFELTEQGRIDRDLTVNSGTVQIDGTVERNAIINAASIEIGRFGEIEGNLNYSAEEFINNGDVRGEINEIEMQTSSFNFEFVGSIYSFLARFLIGVLLLLAFPMTAEKVRENSKDIGRSSLQGLAYLVSVPIVIFLLLITVIGIPLALILLAIFLITVWISTIYGSYAVGDILFKDRKFLALATGLLIWEMLSYVPFLGGVFKFVIALISVGALISPLYVRYRNRD